MAREDFPNRSFLSKYSIPFCRVLNTIEIESKDNSEDTSGNKTYNDAETVKKVQEALNNAGFNCGTPDGIVGSGSNSD